MPRRAVSLLLVSVCAAWAQKYDGPRPPKPDIPYLKHAQNLVATEVGEAKEEKRKEDTMYVVAGAASSARTPLASPIFLMQADKVLPDKLQLYKLDTKNGRRELLLSPKKKQGALPIRIEVMRLSSDGLYKIEVEESLENGEYSLSPDGSNQVFCFQVY
ncbi:MAG: hypothetical protein C5B51_21970 [Terriglobia bacterium]|nr:MAG: hypothetical protein C5B51_21970 [Terriglobia bacterium]